MSDLPNDVLREIMTSETQEERDSQSNWIPRLASYIDRLDDELDSDDAELRAPVHLHPALYALATEGYVKHDLESHDLVEYLIDVILGE
jgi:hypothetical protein